jgi:hypothetical protein
MPGSTPAEFPLRTFSLSGSHGEAAGPGGLGWRQSFADLWNQVALGDLIGCHADPVGVGIRAKQHFEVIRSDLLSLWKGSGSSRRSVLRCAAVSLECSARVWQAFGPAADKRRPDLLCRLEDALLLAGRQIHAAELPVRVNRAAISRAARAACAAIDELLVVHVDSANSLAALEDAAVDLAALAVRIAGSLDQIGSARRAGAKQQAALRRRMEMLACEVSDGARTRRSVLELDKDRDHVGVWLSATLGLAPPAEAIEFASRDDADRCLRADALCSLRARWLELAVGMWLIVQALDDLLATATFGEETRLKVAVGSRAGSALVGSRLVELPGSFDHRQAWDQQCEALQELTRDVCLALQTGEPDAVVCAQQLALRRLARALAAIWTIDQRLRPPLTQAGQRCP